MEPNTMSYIYFISVGLFGVVMALSPQRFMGKAKYNEERVKAEALVKKSGIILAIGCALLTIYYFFFK